MKTLYTKVEIFWEDHHACEEWTQATDPADLGPIVMCSRGFLVSENDIAVQVARDVYMDGSVGIGAPLTILKKCIVSPEKYKVKEK